MTYSNNFTARALVFKALVGSHNYNLNTTDSDKDYKIFVFPNFDDLYNKREYNLNQTSPEQDFTVHDIRKLPEFLWKANLNFIEILYSAEYELPGHIETYWGPAIRILDFLKENRDAITTMNLPELFERTYYGALNKQKMMMKDSPGKHKNFERFGYDTKNACHAVRMLDFLVKLSQDTSNIHEAFYYRNNNASRNLLIDIKQGKYNLEEINKIIEQKATQAKKIEIFFKQQKINEKIFNELNNSIKKNVKSYFVITQK
mgnify:CR=1 FL=1